MAKFVKKLAHLRVSTDYSDTVSKMKRFLSFSITAFLVSAASALAAQVVLVVKPFTLENGQKLEAGSLIEIVDWEEQPTRNSRRFRILSDSSGKAPENRAQVYRVEALNFEDLFAPINLHQAIAQPSAVQGCGEASLKTALRVYEDLYFRVYPKRIPLGHTQIASVIRMEISHSGHSNTLSNETGKPVHMNIRADQVNTERNLILVRTSETPKRVFINVGDRSYHIDFTGAEPLAKGEEIQYLLEHQEGKEAKIAPLTSRNANTASESVESIGFFDSSYRGFGSHSAQWSVTAAKEKKD